MYRAQTLRAEAAATGEDYASQMRMLGLEARIGPACRRDIDRICELVQRTNQFNTTTIRYTRGEVERLLNELDVDVFAAELRDRFGDLGIVCVAVVRRAAGSAMIESFVMSCRAMGFGLEHVVLEHVIRAQEDIRVGGRYVPSGRNEPASNLFAAAGFRESEPGTWTLPAGRESTAPDWFDVKDR
jgi:FkbH-like protein